MRGRENAVGLKDVFRGKRRTRVGEASGEPWRPARHQGEDTVEIAALPDGRESAEAEEDEGGQDRPAERSLVRPTRPAVVRRVRPSPAG
jgi:hypothetical protein